MPSLTIQQMQELLKNPPNRKDITTAVAHERRLRFHAETTLSSATNFAATDFFNWIDTLIPEDKAFVFKALFRYPVKSVGLTEQVFTALEKVFDGRNPVRDIQFNNPETGQDQKEFFDRIEFQDKWKFEAFERCKTAINSVLVVDLPREQQEARPEPYYYFLDIDNVVAFDTTGDDVRYMVFHTAPDRLAYFDTDVYQIFILKEAHSTEITGIEVDVAHDLGWCPAQFFWTTPINHRQQWQKKAPLTNQLSNLDWWLFHAISKQHLDMYASYPIYWGYQQDCDYEDTERGLRCESGWLRNDENNYVISRESGSVAHCPVCFKSRLNGAGSFNEVPAPYDKESADLREPVGVITTDTGSLEYNVAEHKRLGYEIYTNVTGYGGEPVNDQAINEKQVLASFEGRRTVLVNLKKNFERAEKFVVETICKLRYGSSFVSAQIDYGTEFYLYLPEEILEMYSKAKKDGLGDQILNMLQDQYYETKFRNNPGQMQRVKILTALEPFRHLTKTDVRGLYESNLITFDEFYLKLNFANLIDRFERENLNIVQFGSEVDFDKKISAIQKTLYSYGQENKPKEVQPADAGGGIPKPAFAA